MKLQIFIMIASIKNQIENIKEGDCLISTVFEVKQSDPIIQLVGNQTFVVASFNQNAYAFKHVDKENKILSKLECAIPCYVQHQMVSGQQVIVLSTNEGWQSQTLTYWNLSSQTCSSTTVDSIECSQKSYIVGTVFVFQQTKILCYCQQLQQQNFHLSYFGLPLKNQDKPFHTYLYKCSARDQNGRTVLTKPTKLNKHSMIAFPPYSKCFNDEKNNLKFEAYKLGISHSIGTLLSFNINLSQLNLNKFDFLHFRVTDLWEIKQNILYIQFEKQIMIYKYRSKNKDPIKEEGYYNFLWDYETDTIKKLDLNFIEAHRIQFISSIRNISYQQKQYWSIQKRIQQSYSCADILQQPKTINVPIYYIQPQQNIIVVKKQGQTVNFWRYQQKWSGWSNENMLETVSDSTGQGMIVKVNKFPQAWCIYSLGLNMVMAFLICQIAPSCDDDLVREIVKVTENI